LLGVNHLSFFAAALARFISMWWCGNIRQTIGFTGQCHRPRYQILTDATGKTTVKILASTTISTGWTYQALPEWSI